MKMFKKTVMASLLLSVAGLASAHEIPGPATSEPLASANNTYDVYSTTCYSDNGGVGGIPLDPESNSSSAATGLRAGVSLIARSAAGVTAKVTIGASRLVAGVPTVSQASCTDTSVLAGGYTYPTNYCGNGSDGAQAYLNSGNGDYRIVVSHGSTTVGTASYNVVTHCENTALPVGARHTGTGANLTYASGVTIVNGVVTGTVNTVPVPYIKEVNQ